MHCRTMFVNHTTDLQESKAAEQFRSMAKMHFSSVYTTKHVLTISGNYIVTESLNTDGIYNVDVT